MEWKTRPYDPSLVDLSLDPGPFLRECRGPRIPPRVNELDGERAPRAEHPHVNVLAAGGVEGDTVRADVRPGPRPAVGRESDTQKDEQLRDTYFCMYVKRA